MIIYYFTIIWVMVFSGLAQKMDFKTTIDDADKLSIFQKNKANYIYHSQYACYFYILSSLALIIVGGFRFYVGADYMAYYMGWNDYAESFKDSVLKLDEPGYRLICVLFKTIGVNDGAYSIFVASALTIGVSLLIIYRNSDQLLLASLLFLFTCWTGSFNAVRQYLATTFIFCGYSAIKEKHLLEYSLWVFIGFLFHRSAICMLVPYFFIHNELTLKNILFLLLGCIIFLYSYDQVFNFAGIILDKEFNNIEYGSYSFRQVNRFRVIIHCVPAAFFFITVNRQKKDILVNQKFWVNILLFSAAISIASMNSPYLFRMAIFFSPFVVLALCGLLKGFKNENRNIISLMICICYVFFFLYEVNNSNALNNFHFIWER